MAAKNEKTSASANASALTNTERTEKTVKIYIPRRNKADTERFVSVNGRSALIKTGEVVDIPAIFAEVIEESVRADAEADRYTAEMSEGR